MVTRALHELLGHVSAHACSLLVVIVNPDREAPRALLGGAGPHGVAAVAVVVRLAAPRALAVARLVLARFQDRGQPRQRALAVGVLRSLLGRANRNSRGAMHDAHRARRAVDVL